MPGKTKRVTASVKQPITLHYIMMENKWMPIDIAVKMLSRSSIEKNNKCDYFKDVSKYIEYYLKSFLVFKSTYFPEQLQNN